MIKNTKLLKILTLFVTVLFLGTIVSGCGGRQADQNDQATGIELGKEKIELARANWDDQIASTFVVENVLEKMGYNVEQKVVDAGIMWQSVSSGSVDGMVGAWLPLTHETYYEKTKDKLVDLGINLQPTKCGWVVPAYVDIDSITDMNDPAVREKFDGKIYGIEPGAGIMRTSEQAIQEYGLEGYELLDSSGTAMVASLKRAIDNNEWIVITGWTPHWKFARWDLKYIEDPKYIIQGEETQYIGTMVKKGLKDEAPAAYEMLDNFEWEPKHMESVMLDINVNEMEPAAAAEEFVKNNKELVNTWLPQGYSL